jgi:glycerol-3-phosphate dehydrogenase subunit B
VSARENRIRCELLVIGSGIAGMAAALFAANRGIDTLQVGVTGGINYATGLIDLMGVHPIADGRSWDNPWLAIEDLSKDQPDHPYARLEPLLIRRALKEFIEFLEDAGQPYHCQDNRNIQVITPAGTLKTTYALPLAMANGARALEEQAPSLLVDFAGLKGFSARQVAEMLKERWPRLSCRRIRFPRILDDAYAEHYARALEVPSNREQLAERVRPFLKGMCMVGFPAMLGVYRVGEILADMQRLLDVDVFELPTMPPAATGLRLREAFENHLPAKGVKTLYQQRVLPAACPGEKEFFRFQVGSQDPPLTVEARAVVLASGRFFGQGLKAGRDSVRETVFDLPVEQPEGREHWHRKDFFDPRGHALNQCGLVTDRQFRPTDGKGRPRHAHLYAAGSILAHQDWVRQKCGSGLAIATAMAAVCAYADSRGT